MKRALTSALQALAVLILFTIGFALALLPRLQEARLQLAHRLIHQPDLFLSLGIGFFAVAFLLGGAFFLLQRGRYLRIRMGADAEGRVLEKILEECFQANFPKQIVLEGVEIDGGTKLEIAVRLTPTTEKEREALFRSAERQLKQLLKEKLGYTNPFYLTVRIP